MKKESLLKCRCYQVKPCGKVRIFFIAIHTIVRACYVSGNRLRSMICVVIFIIIIIIIYFVFLCLPCCSWTSLQQITLFDVTSFYTQSLGFHSSHNIFSFFCKLMLRKKWAFL